MLSTPSVLIPSITSRHEYSCAGHKTSMPHHCFHLPLHFSIHHFATIYAHPLWISLAITSDHHSHWSLHIRPRFYWVSFSLSFLSPLEFTALYLVPPFNIPFLTLFSYAAFLSVTSPYAHSFPFLPFSFLSRSYWLYHYISWHLLIHLFIHHLIGLPLSYYSSSIVPSIPPTGWLLDLAP